MHIQINKIEIVQRKQELLHGSKRKREFWGMVLFWGMIMCESSSQLKSIFRYLQS